ncbi:LD-carboxypeptidase [Paludibacterium paludis]|nr:LD-carboxypeptidase [Paludibacterium paludis]
MFPTATMPSSLRLRVLASGGPLQDPSRVERALLRFEQAGFAIDNAIAADRRFGRFAGTDEERLADFSCLTDGGAPMPDLLIPTRGGYGMVRLLGDLDYPALCRGMKESGAILCGYSDVTALQMALLAKGGIVSFSGPMLNSDFGAPRMSRFTLDRFRLALSNPVFRVEAKTGRSESLDLEGTLWGGNLAVICQLVGTPYLPAIEGGILFLEDVGEELYRIERMLFQLFHSGILARQKAVLIGRITGSKPDFYDPDGYTITAVLEAIRRRLDVPVLDGLAIGHVPDILSLPVGAHARLTGAEDGYALEIGGYPWLEERAARVNWEAFAQ